MGNAAELETLSAGKIPRTPYHRSPGRGRHTKRKPTTAFIETDGKGPATITPTLELFQRRRWGNFGDNAGRNTTTQDETRQRRTKHDNPGRNTTTQGETRQPRTKHDNPGRNTTTQDETRQPRANHNNPGRIEDQSRQTRTSHDKPRQKPGRITTQDHSRQTTTNQDESRQTRT